MIRRSDGPLAASAVARIAMLVTFLALGVTLAFAGTTRRGSPCPSETDRSGVARMRTEPGSGSAVVADNSRAGKDAGAPAALRTTPPAGPLASRSGTALARSSRVMASTPRPGHGVAALFGHGVI